MIPDLNNKEELKEFVTNVYNGKHNNIYSNQWGRATHYGFTQVGIRELIVKENYKTVLDYGCGHATAVDLLAQQFPSTAFSKYDPFVDEYNKLPTGNYDLIICNQVLQWVSKDYITDTLLELYNLTNKHIFVSTTLNGPGGTLQYTQQEWLDLFSKLFKISKIEHLNQDIHSFRSSILKCLLTKTVK
jgi:hypothetical protein